MGNPIYPQAPYYDDYDPAKGYTRILAIPGRVAQAREFTQAQTIARDLLARLGTSLYREGSIIRGCELTIVQDGANKIAQIGAGEVYLNGIVNKTPYTEITLVGTGEEVLGVKSTQSLVDEAMDESLKEPAQGEDNFGQPGAHRIKEEVFWVLSTNDEDATNVYFLADGAQKFEIPTPEISGVIDLLAERNSEQFGDFVLYGLGLEVVDTTPASDDKKLLKIRNGKARVKGYDSELLTDNYRDLPISRDKKTYIDEPFTFNDGTEQYQLGERPVAEIDVVTATVRTAQLAATSNPVVRGGTPGGSDELAESAVLQIVAVNYQGTWDSNTNTFTGGTDYTEGVHFVRDGNNIDWSIGNAPPSYPADEPPPGSSYNVVYDHRKELTREIVVATEVTNEAIVRDAGATDQLASVDLIDPALFTIVCGDTQGAADYSEGTDFTIDRETGVITWSGGGAPATSNTYYITYKYWNIHTPGDFRARNSYFSAYVDENDNTPVRYNIPFPDHVNFHVFGANPKLLVDGSLVEVDYKQYLAKYALVALTEKEPSIIFGSPAAEPVIPKPDLLDALKLGQVFCPADSPNFIVQEYNIKTVTVEGLTQMLDRISRLELNLSETILDLQAQNVEIADKKGILTDSFANFGKADPALSVEYSIDPDNEEMTLPQTFSTHNLVINTGSSNCANSANKAWLVKNGTTIVQQSFHTGDESTAPYAVVGQGGDFTGMSIQLEESSDNWVVPASETVTQVDDLSRWTYRGQVGSVYRYTTDVIRDIKGYVRQRTITIKAEGLLANVEYFATFADREVTLTPINSTPASVIKAGGIKAKADGTAQMTFFIPPNVPEGAINVSLTSETVWIAALPLTDPADAVKILTVDGNPPSPDLAINHKASAVYTASVVENVTRQFDQCNCNCFTAPPPPPVAVNRDPLAQTINAVTEDSIIESIKVWATQIHPDYGIHCDIRNTLNGVPTDDTIATTWRQKGVLQVGENLFTYEEPVHVPAFKDFALVLGSEFGFVANAPRWVVQGKDMRFQIARVGERDLDSNKILGSQSFTGGTLYKSFDNVSWVVEPLEDLRFEMTKQTFATGLEQVLYFDPVTGTDLTHFVLNCESFQPKGTSVIFEYQLNGVGEWIECPTYVRVKLNTVASQIQIRARLNTESTFVTPFVNLTGSTLVACSRKDTGSYITRNVETSQTFTTLDVFIDFHQPSGATMHTISYATDTVGNTWADFDNNVGPDTAPGALVAPAEALDLNVENVYYRYHYRVTGLANLSNYRIRINGGTGNKTRAPKWKNLVAIVS